MHSSSSVTSSEQVEDTRANRLHNLVLKINMKLGGINQRLAGDWCPAAKGKRLMVLGVDVTHPTGILPQDLQRREQQGGAGGRGRGRGRARGRGRDGDGGRRVEAGRGRGRGEQQQGDKDAAETGKAPSVAAVVGSIDR